MKSIKENVFLNRASVAAFTLLASGVALADDPFTSALAESKTNVAAWGAGLVGLAAASVGFGVAIKFVKKIARAA